MKKYQYSCDGGCIYVGNEKFKVRIPNGFGDGTFTVKIIDDHKKVPDGYDFKAALDGEFGIYDYDCYTKEDFESHCLVRLNGFYSLYVNNGKVILQER